MDNLFFTYSKTVIVCKGTFPSNEIPLQILRHAKTIICCDGAIENLLLFGIEPSIVVGDLDSVSKDTKKKYSSKIFHNPDQNTNDLTKAVLWAQEHNYTEITILGATGLREDHTIGNILLLADFESMGLTVTMVTDTGILTPISKRTTFQSFVGQQVSVFSLDLKTEFGSEKLKYPIPKRLPALWYATLNESLADEFTISICGGVAIVYQTFERK